MKKFAFIILLASALPAYSMEELPPINMQELPGEVVREKRIMKKIVQLYLLVSTIPVPVEVISPENAARLMNVEQTGQYIQGELERLNAKLARVRATK